MSKTNTVNTDTILKEMILAFAALCQFNDQMENLFGFQFCGDLDDRHISEDTLKGDNSKLAIAFGALEHAIARFVPAYTDESYEKEPDYFNALNKNPESVKDKYIICYDEVYFTLCDFAEGNITLDECIKRITSQEHWIEGQPNNYD